MDIEKYDVVVFLHSLFLDHTLRTTWPDFAVDFFFFFFYELGSQENISTFEYCQILCGFCVMQSYVQECLKKLQTSKNILAGN